MKQPDTLDRIAEPFIGYSLPFFCVSVVGVYISLEWFDCCSPSDLSTADHMNGAIVPLLFFASLFGAIHTATVMSVSTALQRLRNHPYRTTYWQHIACGMASAVLFSTEFALSGVNGTTFLGWNALWILPIGSAIGLIAINDILSPSLHPSSGKTTPQ